MGFFNKLFTESIALNRLAKTCDECLNCISRFKYSNDFDEIIKCAWLYTYGILGSIDKWNWNTYRTLIYIPNHQELGRVPISQVNMIILGSLSRFSEEYNATDIIDNIIDEGDQYKKYEYLCSINLKNKLKP